MSNLQINYDNEEIVPVGTSSASEHETYHKAEQFAKQAGMSLIKYSSAEFFEEIHSKFYTSIDVGFRKYLEKLLPFKGQFVVPHTKLIDFGVMSSKNSSHAAKKLNSLGLVAQGGFVKTMVYYLTPKSFMDCLLYAKPFQGQPVNPRVYGEFFQLVLEIDYLYQVYENAYFKMMNEIRGIALKDAEEARDQERKEKLEAIAREQRAEADRKEAREREQRAETDRKRAAEAADEFRAISQRLEERVIILTANNNKLIDDNSHLVNRVDDMSDQINGLSGTVEEIRQELSDQKILSTMLPISRNLDHYVAVAMLETEHSWMVQIIAKQELSFDKKLADFVHEDIKILSAKTFIANGINFRNNVMTYNTAAIKSICRRDLSKLKRNGLKLGKMKTVIPKDCPFTLELFMASFDDVLTDTQVKERFASLKKN